MLLYGYNTADDSGDSMTAAFSTPMIFDQIPESNGATWTNGAGVTEVEKDADGTASTRTYAADGTYTETTTSDAGLVNATTTENADGSGSLVTNGSYLTGLVNSLTFSAPASNQVTVTVNFVQSPAPQPAITPRTYTATAWYGTAKPVLFSQNSTVTTGVTYPANCIVPSVYGTSGNEVVQTTNRLDTIFGYTDSQTQTTYTNAQFGPVCVVLSDVLTNYYDYQDDFATPDAVRLHFPGTPLSTSTTSQMLTLQAGAGIRTESKSAQSAPPPLSLARIASASAAFQLRVERLRRQKLPAFKEKR